MKFLTQASRKRIGWLVISALAVLTAVEFWLSSAIQPALPYLTVTAIVKAGLIIYYFMHLSQLWKQEGPH